MLYHADQTGCLARVTAVPMLAPGQFEEVRSFDVRDVVNSRAIERFDDIIDVVISFDIYDANVSMLQ